MLEVALGAEPAGPSDLVAAGLVLVFVNVMLLACSGCLLACLVFLAGCLPALVILAAAFYFCL